MARADLVVVVPLLQEAEEEAVVAMCVKDSLQVPCLLL
jgi:hypothetical protein